MSTNGVVPQLDENTVRVSDPKTRYEQLVDLSELLEIALIRLDALKQAAFREMTQGQDGLF
ncbi:MAG: hypothetical protein M3443_06180 [Actinomycetota bacterium]|nr:hypothetical protein [Actinomycetota bacterium]